jgi:hypothetical protein
VLSLNHQAAKIAVSEREINGLNPDISVIAPINYPYLGHIDTSMCYARVNLLYLLAAKTMHTI